MKLHPCIWYSRHAREAVNLYREAFQNVQVVSENGPVLRFKIKEKLFMGLDGGDLFSPSPAISFYISFSTKEETTHAWNVLARNGKALMPLDSYEWNEHFGWIADPYGVNWQLWTGSLGAQEVVPGLMFCGAAQGKAAAAMDFYMSIFPNSSLGMIARYPEEAGPVAGQVVHAEFSLQGVLLKAFDSGVPQPFTFNEGISLVLYCDTQAEIDYYWRNLISDGGKESMCGWCQDRFGVWWQVVPTVLQDLMDQPQRAERVTTALLQMQKIEIASLLEA